LNWSQTVARLHHEHI